MLRGDHLDAKGNLIRAGPPAAAACPIRNRGDGDARWLAAVSDLLHSLITRPVLRGRASVPTNSPQGARNN
jgi:hypothetical protein